MHIILTALAATATVTFVQAMAPASEGSPPPATATGVPDSANSSVVVPSVDTDEGEDASATPPPAPPPPTPEPLFPRRYGDRGTSEAALGLGYSSETGWAAVAGFRHFVLAGVAPGLEASTVSGGSRFSAVGMILAGLRLVPFRAPNVALVLTGRGGRVLLARHPDGWGAGGAAGVIIALGSGVGIEVGYEALRLLPAHFCADLPACVIHGPVFGLRLSF